MLIKYGERAKSLKICTQRIETYLRYMDIKAKRKNVTSFREYNANEDKPNDYPTFRYEYLLMYSLSNLPFETNEEIESIIAYELSNTLQIEVTVKVTKKAIYIDIPAHDLEEYGEIE